jgi:predicted XRE-type DNA-binding protein
MARRAVHPIRIEPSSGNVLADLGMTDAAELDTKVRLAVEINRLIKDQRLTQVTAAECLKVSQPVVCALKSYKLDGVSIERLRSFLLALRQDVDIRMVKDCD